MSNLSNYKVLSKIGEGTYGVVYKAESLTSEGPDEIAHDLVAMKKIRLSDHQEGVPVTTLREVALLKQLCHPNIVRLRDIIPSSPKLYLVFDFMDLDLKQCMDSRFCDGMPDEYIKSCMEQILRGVDFCHSNDVLHRDLKPQNVLIDREGRVKLADFGLARAFHSNKIYTHEVVTLWYRAPELLLGQEKYTAAVDIWSVGCIFAELACRKPLFPGDSEIDELFKIFKCLGTPDEAVWPGVGSLPWYQDQFPRWSTKEIGAEVAMMSEEAVGLLQRLLVYEPCQRLKAEDALESPYFDAVRGKDVLLSLDDYKLAADNFSPASEPPTQSTVSDDIQPVHVRSTTLQPEQLQLDIENRQTKKRKVSK